MLKIRIDVIVLICLGGKEMARDLSYTICPRCGKGVLVPIGERTGGFSGGKAVLGAVIAGPLGLAAGALGKKKITYLCQKCGYTVEV